MVRYVVPRGGAHAEEAEVGLMVSVSLMHAKKSWLSQSGQRC